MLKIGRESLKREGSFEKLIPPLHTQETGVNSKAVFIKYNPNPSQPGKGQ